MKIGFALEEIGFNDEDWMIIKNVHLGWNYYDLVF